MTATGAKGSRAEREARDILRAHGYFVVKAGGSKGPVDLLAIRPGVVLFVQVKCGTGRLRPPEWNALLDLAQFYGAVPVLAERPDRRPMAWWELAGPKTEGGRGPQPYRPIVVADTGPAQAAALARLAAVSGINPVPGGGMSHPPHTLVDMKGRGAT